MDTKEQRDSNKEKKKEIVQEIISIVQKRGGKFLDASLNVLSNKEAIDKTKYRFNDMRKLLKTNKRKFVPHTAAAIESMKKGEISSSAAALSKAASERRGGFSSVKSTVSSSSQLPKVKKRKKATSKSDVADDKEESKRRKLTSVEHVGGYKLEVYTEDR